MSQALLDLLREKFGAQILETSSQFGDETAVVAPSAWRAVALFLRDDPACRMTMMVDLCGSDYLGRTPRFEVVLHLYSLEKGHRLRLKARVGDAEGEAVEVDSLVSVWPGANWFEREAFDMFGIVFAGHPDLRRILLYPEFEGHPLRKDYPADRVQPLVPFREGYEKQPPFDRFEGMSFGRNALPKGTVE